MFVTRLSGIVVCDITVTPVVSYLATSLCYINMASWCTHITYMTPLYVTLMTVNSDIMWHLCLIGFDTIVASYASYLVTLKCEMLMTWPDCVISLCDITMTVNALYNIHMTYWWHHVTIRNWCQYIRRLLHYSGIMRHRCLIRFWHYCDITCVWFHMWDVYDMA